MRAASLKLEHSKIHGVPVRFSIKNSIFAVDRWSRARRNNTLVQNLRVLFTYEKDPKRNEAAHDVFGSLANQNRYDAFPWPFTFRKNTHNVTMCASCDAPQTIREFLEQIEWPAPSSGRLDEDGVYTYFVAFREQRFFCYITQELTFQIYGIGYLCAGRSAYWDSVTSAS